MNSTSSYFELDYALARACLEHRKFAWEDFVDRFMDLTLHTIRRVARKKGRTLSEEDETELCEAIFRSFRYNDYQLLREFAFQSALSTYLTVLARRLVYAFLEEERLDE